MEEKLLENAAILHRWFPSLEVEIDDDLVSYMFYLNQDMMASVHLFVGFNQQNVLISSFTVELFHEDDVDYERRLKFKFSCTRELALISFAVSEDSYLDCEGINTLGSFLEMFWEQIWEKRKEQYGIIAGAWLSGAFWVWE